MVVTTPENEIAKMQVSVNEQLIEQEFSVNEAAVTWIYLPHSNDGHTFRNCKFFDKNGNLMDEY
ncbi:MAG: hypothetical protein ACQEWV_28200 [Bacillota bacterium]